MSVGIWCFRDLGVCICVFVSFFSGNLSGVSDCIGSGLLDHSPGYLPVGG